jgi:hypothetical protein
MEQLPKPKLAWLALPVLAGISALLIAYGPGVIYEAVTGEPPKDFDQPVDPGYRHLGTDKQLAEEIDALFESFAVGKGPASSGKRILADGWIMKWPGNGTIHRAILREFAEPIIAHGPKAVPYLLRWVRYHHCAVRYIATYSLERITDQHPFVLHFAGGHEDPNTEHAIRVWAKWWLAHGKGSQKMRFSQSSQRAQRKPEGESCRCVSSWSWCPSC